ncbi:MAG: hypothetical protein JWM85_2645, partial [Acidimicrobiaceae bacterium]|nr:hypothetical protein [Acidimicrobiaceae bacterium]
TWVNDVFNLVPWSNASDNSMFNLDNTVTNLRWRGDYFRGASGSALEWTENPCFDSCTSTTDTGAEISSNAFTMNSTEDNGTFYGDIDTTHAPYATGTVQNNLYYDASQTYNAFCHSCAYYTQSNNLAADSDSDLYNAPYDFSGTQHQDNWDYSSDASGTWADMSTYTTPPYSDDGRWSDGYGGSISQFDETPPPNNNYLARVWTAPKAGTIQIRGWILKNTVGGDGVYADIWDTGTLSVLWQSTVSGSDQTGMATNVDDVSVNAGDEITFSVNNNNSGNNTDDTVSWAPSIAYTSSSSGVGGQHKVVNVNSGLCMQVDGNSTSNGADANQWECDQGSSKEWDLSNQGSGQYELVNANSGLCLQVVDDSTTAGARVDQWECDQGSSKLWTLTDEGSGQYELVNVNADLCLQVDSSSTTNGAYLSLWSCASESKLWTLQ